jgi:hypothetical protein
MRNLLAHALLPDPLRDASPIGQSTERVLRDQFWQSGNERPLGTLTSLAEAREKKLRRSRR